MIYTGIMWRKVRDFFIFKDSANLAYSRGIRADIVVVVAAEADSVTTLSGVMLESRLITAARASL